MINLLPPQEKRDLYSQAQTKLAIVLGNMALIVVVCLLLMLISLKFYLLGQVDYYQSLLQIAEKEYGTPSILAAKETVKNYNADLAKIDAFYRQQNNLSDALALVSTIQKPPGIHFSGISIAREKGAMTMLVTVSGTSDTRDTLIALRDTLSKNPKIQNVAFPPDSWTKDSAIDFQVTFQIH